MPPFGAPRASRVESAAVVVARRGKNASAHSSSVRRRAIPDARSALFGSCSRIARGIRRRRRRSQRKERLRSLLLRASARDSRRSQRPFWELLAHRAWNPPPSSSLAEERTPPLTPPPCVGARFPTLAAPFLGAARASRVESAAVVVVRRGKNASAQDRK